jgi:hypothetical protein
LGISARPATARHQRLLLAGTFVILVAGCVTLTPMQRDAVAEVQAFADATSTHYKMSRVGVVVESSTNLNIGAHYRLGHLYINVESLGSVHLTALVAHELAHYVLAHDTPPAGSSMADSQQAQELRELDANGKAVEILMQVKGKTERQAVQTFVSFLTAAQRAQDRGAARPWGHRAPIGEIADLLERFPNSR